MESFAELLNTGRALQRMLWFGTI